MRSSFVCWMFALCLILLFHAPIFAEPAPPVSGFTLVAQDDCGTKTGQPHLIQGQNWTITDEERAGATIDDERLKHFAYHEQSVRFRFLGVRPDAKYTARVHYYNVAQDRTVRLDAGGRELHGPLELTKNTALVREAAIPPAAYRTGMLTISCSKVAGSGAIVSAIELWSDKPGFLTPIGSFVRFRIDEFPASAKNIAVNAVMKIHASPWTTPSFALTPKDGATKIGVTPWVNLRSLPGGANGSLILSIPDGVKGATQFSIIGEGDVITREFRFDEPDGKRIIVEPSFTDLRTFREQERRYYFNALQHTGEKLYPLTRPPLMFSNAWGHTTGGAAEYMVKSFRLMGFNSVETSADAEAYEKYYGWHSQGGHYSPPGLMPFDEEKSRAGYQEHYRNYFAKGGKGEKTSPGMRIFQLADEPGEAPIKDSPAAQEGFRKWVQSRGVQPALFGKQSWDEVKLSLAKPAKVEDRPIYYWSRLYQSYLTPKMYALAAEAVREQSPGKQAISYVALSGHSMNFGNKPPLDMFQLAQYPSLMPGISDWMTSGTWWWDGHESVAFSVAMFNGGARRIGVDAGKTPISFPMMHCVSPSLLRATIQLANNCKLISYYTYGPDYESTEGFWSHISWMPAVVGTLNNRAAQVDDILSPGSMRHGRVAMLWSASQDVWSPQATFTDKRAAFLAMGHDYFQPELITEQQVREGALGGYDALYILDPCVARDVQETVGAWVNSGGLLWACADAASYDEFYAPCDLLTNVSGIKRSFPKAGEATKVIPVDGEKSLTAHAVPAKGKYGEVIRPGTFEWAGAKIRATYEDQSPACAEKSVGKGAVIYVAHRAGASYSARAGKRGQFANWPEAGREFLTAPLMERKIQREMWLSTPLVSATPISTDAGTVVVMYDLHASPSNDVVLTLREPARPHSVQTFDGNGALIDLPFEFADGEARISIKQITWNGMMVVVRRKPAPADDRLATMRATAEAGLASDNWQALSAAAWFAGFYPDWKLAPKLTPLLKHKNWAVRRSAAEALGRLAHRESAAAILEALDTETDSHALADELHALVRLRDPKAKALCEKYRESEDVFLQREAGRAMATLLKTSSDEP